MDDSEREGPGESFKLRRIRSKVNLQGVQPVCSDQFLKIKRIIGQEKIFKMMKSIDDGARLGLNGIVASGFFTLDVKEHIVEDGQGSEEFVVEFPGEKVDGDLVWSGRSLWNILKHNPKLPAVYDRS